MVVESTPSPTERPLPGKDCSSSMIRDHEFATKNGRLYVHLFDQHFARSRYPKSLYLFRGKKAVIDS